MMYAILASCLLAIFIPAATSHPSSFICPNTMVTAPNFDPQQYTGLWYEYAKYFDLSELNAKCITSEYALNGNGTLSVYNSGIDATTRAKRAIRAVARIPNMADASKFKVKFPDYKLYKEANYWVVATDYKNYSIVYACRQLSPTSNQVRLWILTRARFPSPAVVQELMRNVESHGFETANLLSTDHTDC